MFQNRVKIIQNAFKSATSPADIYQKILDFSSHLPDFPNEHMTSKNKIKGCQSALYVHSSLKNGKLFFNGHSDALISSGLCALMIETYSGLCPKEIALNPPKFLEQMGIIASLSINRSQGIAYIYLRMKQDALRALVQLSAAN